MYLESFTLNNYRKYGEADNCITFVDSKGMKKIDEEPINIAPMTNLIVGKNNSGKTSIVTALNTLINYSSQNNFKANDFNFLYLKNLLKQYIKDNDYSSLPMIEFKIVIGLNNESEDLLTNVYPFMKIDDVKNKYVEIKVKFSAVDEEVLRQQLIENFNNESEVNSENFSLLLKIINESDYYLIYTDTEGNRVRNFKLKQLVELKLIKANNIKNERSLSDAFGKIIRYRKDELNEQEREKLNSLNASVDELIKEDALDINEKLSKLLVNDDLQMSLKSDIDVINILQNIIKYEYVEKDHSIPESHFGLGYTNMVLIVAEIIQYMEQYQEDAFNSSINLLSIEEPETFMHPQMQEQFINNINDTVEALLESKEKTVNCQLIITTHSSNILNSKIHSGNTFNNINYITTHNGFATSIELNDEEIIDSKNPNKINDLNFLKKHIKFKVSELFFADGVIFVEGPTEEVLIKYLLDNDECLSKYFISVFNIDGAHGLKYHKLIQKLKVPCLVITDLDIKRNDEQKQEFIQIDKLDALETTNQTIIEYNKNQSDISNIDLDMDKIPENMYITYQLKSNGYFPTSFEEAIILKNWDNDSFNTFLSKTKPKIYKEIEDSGRNLKEVSFKFQSKLSSEKTLFSNKLLYQFLTDNIFSENFQPPEYIKQGFSWLSNKLKEV